MTYPPDVLHENRTVQDAIDYALEIEASLDPAANRLGLESSGTVTREFLVAQ